MQLITKHTDRVISMIVTHLLLALKYDRVGAYLHIDVLCRLLLFDGDDELHLRAVVLVQLAVGGPLANHLNQRLFLWLLRGRCR